jgi:hypothetical protein
VLDISEYRILDLDVTSDNNTRVNVINPSVSKDFIYFRIVYNNSIMIPCDTCIFNKKTHAFTVVEKHSTIPSIEDLRIFDYNDRVWFVGYMRNTTRIFETYLGYFDSDCQRIEKVVGCIKSPGKHVKNITPLIHDNTLFLIDVLTGIVYDETATPVHTIDKTCLHNVVAQYDDIMVCGTTPYVHISGTVYGGLAHTTIRICKEILYVYIWIEIDVATWRITFASQPYIIKKLGLVFVSYIEKFGDNVFQLMFGENDSQACRCITTLESLRASAIRSPSPSA